MVSGPHYDSRCTRFNEAINMFYGNQMTLGAALVGPILSLNPNGLSKDYHLSETITRSIECWRPVCFDSSCQNSE